VTFQRKLVSAFIVWHLIATVTAAMPSGTWVGRASGATPNAITRFLDRSAAAIIGAIADGRATSNRVIGKPVEMYVSLTGLGQRWGMFSTPWEFDRYWRIRYYVRTSGGGIWSSTEVLAPAQFNGGIRLVQSFRDSFRDKAIELATQDFGRRRRADAIRPDARPQDLPDDLAPIARYFARRFVAERLDPRRDRLVRTEIWVGSVDNAPPGRAPDDASRSVRAALLQTYASGPVDNRLPPLRYAPYQGVENEADIRWLLEYFEEP